MIGLNKNKKLFFLLVCELHSFNHVQFAVVIEVGRIGKS